MNNFFGLSGLVSGANISLSTPDTRRFENYNEKLISATYIGVNNQGLHTLIAKDRDSTIPKINVFLFENSSIENIGPCKYALGTNRKSYFEQNLGMSSDNFELHKKQLLDSENYSLN